MEGHRAAGAATGRTRQAGLIERRHKRRQAGVLHSVLQDAPWRRRRALVVARVGTCAPDGTAPSARLPPSTARAPIADPFSLLTAHCAPNARRAAIGAAHDARGRGIRRARRAFRVGRGRGRGAPPAAPSSSRARQARSLSSMAAGRGRRGRGGVSERPRRDRGTRSRKCGGRGGRGGAARRMRYRSTIRARVGGGGGV